MQDNDVQSYALASLASSYHFELISWQYARINLYFKSIVIMSLIYAEPIINHHIDYLTTFLGTTSSRHQGLHSKVRNYCQESLETYSSDLNVETLIKTLQKDHRL